MSENSIYKAEERALASRSALPAYGLIAVGAGLLLAQIFHIELIDVLWPGFVLVPGLLLLLPARSSTEDYNHPLSFLAVPGAVVAMVGTLLFAMNITDHFEAWAYSWTLVFVAGAAGWAYIYRFEPDHSVHQRAHKLIRTMAYLFIGFAIFFELIIFGNLTPWLPIFLIGYGAYLLVNQNKEKTIA